jgi:hypothetical protein
VRPCESTYKRLTYIIRFEFFFLLKVYDEYKGQDGAPPKLVKKVKDLGRDPLYQYLLPKLETFRSNGRFREKAYYWGAIEADLADVTTPEALYQYFMIKRPESADLFQCFLREEDRDSQSWECMMKFEDMMKESTTYERFMELFKETLAMLKETPLFKGKPKGSKALLNVYDEYKGLDLEHSRKKK